MGLSSAIVSSMNGLNVTAKLAEVTSLNISNVTTDGYGKKTLRLSGGPGASVFVSAVQREVDLAINRLHHQEIGKAARQGAILRNVSTHTSLLGGPDNPLNVPSQLASFQSNLNLLANTPGDQAIQRVVVESANSLARSLNLGAQSLEQAKALTQESAGLDTAAANDLLRSIAATGRKMVQEDMGTLRQVSLEDDLARDLDALAQIMDFRIERTTRGEISVFTGSGTALLERNAPIALRYDAQGGRLYAGEIDITPGEDGRRGISEGRLAGHLAVQNTLLPRMQTQFDEVARNLIQRFQAADASLAPGEAGLFIDGDPQSLIGLAGRLRVNPAVFPESGGALWRIRDGIGASQPGAENNNAQIRAFVNALDQPMTFDGAAGLFQTGRLVDFASALVADQQSVRVRAAEAQAEFQAGAEAINATRSAIEGVNLDQELQRLLTIEQNYAANATMMKTLNEMFETLLRAT